MSTSTVQLRGGPFDGHQTEMAAGTLVLMIEHADGEQRYVREVDTETVRLGR